MYALGTTFTQVLLPPNGIPQLDFAFESSVDKLPGKNKRLEIIFSMRDQLRKERPDIQMPCKPYLPLLVADINNQFLLLHQ